MQSEVITKRTGAAAAALRDSTEAIWEWEAHVAAAQAVANAQTERVVLRAQGALAPDTVVNDALYVAYSAEQAKTDARNVPKAWEVYCTPDEDDRSWVLVPNEFDGTVPDEPERTRLVDTGAVVIIAPGDTVETITANLDAAREARVSTSAQGVGR